MGHFDKLDKAKLAETLAGLRAPRSNVAELCTGSATRTGTV